MAKNKKSLGILVLPAGVVLFLAGVAISDYLEDKRENEILHKGTDATATVLKIVDTGSRSNHNPVCDVTLSVKPEGEPAFRVVKEMVLSIVDLTNFKVGSVVPVRFDPKDRTQVVVIR